MSSNPRSPKASPPWSRRTRRPEAQSEPILEDVAEGARGDHADGRDPLLDATSRSACGVTGAGAGSAAMTMAPTCGRAVATASALSFSLTCTTARSSVRSELVMTAGSPLGLSGTVSVGVLSGFRSLFGSDYLQFTTAISPGNSGGPVVDRKGRVVGIATAKLMADGAEALGFAIPVQNACATLAACAQA
jgi:hypothetical protein